jgi:hypothetical protein
MTRVPTVAEKPVRDGDNASGSTPTISTTVSDGEGGQRVTNTRVHSFWPNGGKALIRLSRGEPVPGEEVRLPVVPLQGGTD